MFGAKLIAFAAAAALTVAHVSATNQATHIKIYVRRARGDYHHDGGVVVDVEEDDDAGTANATLADSIVQGRERCVAGWTQVSVEGMETVYCAKGQICVADKKDGACPVAQQGLPYGAYCDVVKTGVYGCKPETKDLAEEDGDAPLCSGEGESPMSVEGVEGVFCVTGLACVADIANGACPGPQKGLPYGAQCGKVKTGVYGCQPKTEANGDDGDDNEEEEQKEAPEEPEDGDSDDDDVCEQGESPMSVEGVEGVFCVAGQACAADIMGACPGPHDGLEHGAECGTVSTGVYGCKPISAKSHHQA